MLCERTFNLRPVHKSSPQGAVTGPVLSREEPSAYYDVTLVTLSTPVPGRVVPSPKTTACHPRATYDPKEKQIRII